MAIDTLEALRMALRDFGQPASIAGDDIGNGILFDHAPAQADPYRDDRGHDGPGCSLLLEDLQAIGQWPLQAREIVTDGMTYRIVRHSICLGEVRMFLRGAE